MVGAGFLDRRIIIERATVAPDDFNEPVETWSTLATVYANAADVSAGEGYRAQEVGAQISTRFTVRYSTTTATVTPTDRISFKGRIYNITEVREKTGTRNRWIEIDAAARSDAPMIQEGSP